MGIRPAARVEVLDEGVSQGRVSKLNVTGAGASASVAGDTATLNVPAGGGGSFSATTVTVACPYPASRRVSVNVVDALVGAASNIVLSLRGVDETDVNSSDTVDILSLQALAKAGSFDFQALFLTPFAGPLKINYAIG